MAKRVTDPAEQPKIGSLLFSKFPQISEYVPEDAQPEDLVLFRIDPRIISLLDYRKGFGHTELMQINGIA